MSKKKNIKIKINEIFYLKNLVINPIDKEEWELSQKINNISSEVTKSQNNIDNIIKEIKKQIDLKTISDNEKIYFWIKQNLFNSKIQKYKNVCIWFSNQESDIKNII